ncbi:MAG: Endonuclease/exonuclease/phosphatase [Monoraphidium minutum]|nr:MAG: Endonuclease/exonuclease/phosphatase [Monoraphidium minutum]
MGTPTAPDHIPGYETARPGCNCEGCQSRKQADYDATVGRYQEMCTAIKAHAEAVGARPASAARQGPPPGFAAALPAAATAAPSPIGAGAAGEACTPTTGRDAGADDTGAASSGTTPADPANAAAGPTITMAERLRAQEQQRRRSRDSAGGTAPANVNGMANLGKRLALFARLAELGSDIVVLQETHCGSDEQAAAWLSAGAGVGRAWTGLAYWSHYRQASRGVGILFKHGFPADDVCVEYGGGPQQAAAAGTAGRVLRVGWRDPASHQRWSVVAVYAPNADDEQAQFFAADGPLSEALAAGPAAAHVVLAGDFNCITDSMDSSSPNAAQQAATRGAQALRELTAHFSLADAWQHHRARRPGASGEVYTHWATLPGRGTKVWKVCEVEK